MGLEGELELIQIVRKFNLRYEHRLEQKKITNYFSDIDYPTISECQYYLRKNRMLPRIKSTKQIDLLVWKEPHWAALAIEEKDREGASKRLDIYKDKVVLKTTFGYGEKEIIGVGRDLSLQCLGESYLGKAYLTANNLDYKVLPLAVVDYTLTINSLVETAWAFSNGIFFINKSHFEWFLEEYCNDSSWIKKVYERSPKIFYDAVA